MSQLSDVLTRIPILDLTPEIEELWDELMEAIQRVMRSGRFILGPEVDAFEAEFAAYLGVKHAIGVNSGTDALLIALRALGVGPGDEVITTPFTFFATAESISNLGATPVFVDIDPRTFNIDPELIESAITERTKAIVPVHLYGQAADMDPITAIAHRHGLKVVEDVAQAAGGSYKALKNGALGDAGAFSFFPSKNLGGFGDGGMIATDDDDAAHLSRKLRTHGSIRKYANKTLGYNSRLDELQAAMLRVKLRRLDGANELRREACRRYSQGLAGVSDIVLPHESSHVRHVYHQYTIKVLKGRRDELAERLRSDGIGTMSYYPVPLHRLPTYASGTDCAFAVEACEQVLSLPLWPTIGATTQGRVISALGVDRR